MFTSSRLSLSGANLVLAAMVLAGCGGSSGSDPARVGGSLVIPDNGEEGTTAARMIDGAGWLARMTPGCPDVPARYRPLVANLSLLSMDR